MAGLKQPIRGILTQLGTLNVTNQDNQTVALFARVFNDQYRKLKDGEIEHFPLPASLLQVVAPTNMKRIGGGVAAGDIVFRVHLAHEHMDSGDGTMEQDLDIFDLRDQVINLLSDFQPLGCSPLMYVSDTPNNDHTNLYIFEIDFVTHFLDNTGVQDKYNSVTLTDAQVNRDGILTEDPQLVVQTISPPKPKYQI